MSMRARVSGVDGELRRTPPFLRRRVRRLNDRWSHGANQRRIWGPTPWFRTAPVEILDRFRPSRGPPGAAFPCGERKRPRAGHRAGTAQETRFR